MFMSWYRTQRQMAVASLAHHRSGKARLHGSEPQYLRLWLVELRSLRAKFAAI